MTRREAFRGALDLDGRRIVVRASYPLPDLTRALRGARPLGTQTRARRSWRIEHGRLWLRFAMIDPCPTQPRAFELSTAELVEAFSSGFAVGLDTRPNVRARGAANCRLVIPLWPTEALRFDVLDALRVAGLRVYPCDLAKGRP